MLVVKVPIAFPESRPPLLRLRCEYCIAATIIRFIIETEKTPRCLPRGEKGVVSDASTLKLPPTSANPLPLLLPLLLLLFAATTKQAEERADEEKAIQFVSVTAERRKKNVRVLCVRCAIKLSLSGCALARADRERAVKKGTTFAVFICRVSSRERIKNNGEGRAPGG